MTDHRCPNLADELSFFREAGRPVLEPEARGKEPPA